MITSPMDELRQLDHDTKSFVLATGILIDRIQSLPDSDRELVWKLVRCLAEATTQEEQAEAHEAMLEILDQHKVEVVDYPVDEDTLGSAEGEQKFQKWKDWISATIRRERESAGLTQVKLAELTGLPQSHISRIECAKLSPSHTTLKKIAEALGIDVAKLDVSQS